MLPPLLMGETPDPLRFNKRTHHMKDSVTGGVAALQALWGIRRRWSLLINK